MLFHEFKKSQVVQYTDSRGKVIRGIVTEKGYTHVCIMWAVSKEPDVVHYTISEIDLLAKMSFYAWWENFNTVPVRLINKLNEL